MWCLSRGDNAFLGLFCDVAWLLPHRPSAMQPKRDGRSWQHFRQITVMEKLALVTPIIATVSSAEVIGRSQAPGQPICV